jgi:hypothetical protein
MPEGCAELPKKRPEENCIAGELNSKCMALPVERGCFFVNGTKDPVARKDTRIC